MGFWGPGGGEGGGFGGWRLGENSVKHETIMREEPEVVE